METRDAMKCVQQWLSQESLEFKTLSDSRAEMHLHVRYPPTRNGHLFNIVIPKKRSLVMIKSPGDENMGGGERREKSGRGQLAGKSGVCRVRANCAGKLGVRV